MCHVGLVKLKEQGKSFTTEIYKVVVQIDPSEGVAAGGRGQGCMAPRRGNFEISWESHNGYGKACHPRRRLVSLN